MKSRKLTGMKHRVPRIRLWQAWATAADKMNDFQFVAIFKRGCFPLGAGNDFKVQLHGHTVRLHAELRHQAQPRSGRRESRVVRH